MRISEQQLDRIIYSHWDFQQALSALTFLAEECSWEPKYPKPELRRFKCYESTAIISFARPFQASRGCTTLSLKSLGITLNSSQMQLKNKLIVLRNKIIAHSDFEEMHFRASTFTIPSFDLKVPELQFDEGLSLTEEEVREFMELLILLRWEISNWLFLLAQRNPEMLNKYKLPEQRQASEGHL